jgi:beta-phosphoglucomutase family hydrolase
MTDGDLTPLGLPRRIRAGLFDLDGVLTRTADVHAAAWKDAFDQVLVRWSDAHRRPTEPFDVDRDYLRYVDGKRREDGVRSFLASRGIDLAEGSPDDDPTALTISGVSTLKNDLLLARIARDGVAVFDGSVDYLHEVVAAGLRRAVVSSSANTAAVLEATGLDDLMEERVDGVVMAERNLPGKPDPAGFLLGAQLLGVEPAEAVVFEDAISGVQAGQAGEFGYVVGVNRSEGDGHDEHRDALMSAGADVVVDDLSELLA